MSRKYLNSLKIAVSLLLLFVIATAEQSAALAQTNPSLLFVENVGQFDSNVQFLVYLSGGTLQLTPEALWLTVVEPPQQPPDQEINPEEPPAQRGVTLKLAFEGANPQSRLEPFNRLSTPVSYFTGRLQQAEVPVWGGVRYVDLYPGIDLEITGENGRLVQRLVVKTGDISAQSTGSLGDIRLQIEGTDDVFVENGQVRVSTALGELPLPPLTPVDAGGRPLTPPAEAQVTGPTEVTSPFTAPTAEISSQSAQIAAAGDLLYSTFLGGAGTFDNGYGIDIDDEGYAYVTGQADPGFPTTPGAFDTSLVGVYNEVFVAKLSPDGSNLEFATYLGGSDWEISTAIHVHSNGNITVAGHTTSTDFPTTPGAFDRVMDGESDMYVTRFNPTGTALVFSTLIGGSSNDFSWGMAVNDADEVFLTGTTYSDDFPVSPGAVNDTYNMGDAFALKLAADGSDVLLATYLGGSSFDNGNGIAVTPTGHVFVAGRTGSTDFPTTPGALRSLAKQSDVFVVKLTPDFTGYVYSTLLGGAQNDTAAALAVDEAGFAYVTGDTLSPDFPTTPGALSTDCTSCLLTLWKTSGFVSKLNLDGSALVYSTFLGGINADHPLALYLSQTGSVYVTGYTLSPDFPTTPGAFDTECELCDEEFSQAAVFVSRLNPNFSSLAYSTFLDGAGIADRGTAIVADAEGNAYVTGSTDSADFPTTPGAYDVTKEGYYDVFISKLATGSDDLPPPTVPAHSCAPTVLGSVAVGRDPRGLAVDPTRNRVYVANADSGTVSVIDTTSNIVQQTIAGIPGANGVAFDTGNNIIWVTSPATNAVFPIQANGDATAFTLLPAVAVGDHPWGVAYSPVFDTVVVVNNGDDSVTVIDASAQTVMATLGGGAFNTPWHAAADIINGKVYVTNGGNNSVTVVENAAVKTVVPLYDSGTPYGIAVDETRQTVYVATVHTHRIVAIGRLNGQLDQFLGWASFQRGYNPNRPVPLRMIAVNPGRGWSGDGGHIWATTTIPDGSEDNQVLLIPKGWSSRFHVPFATAAPWNPAEGLAVDRVHNRVYVSGGSLLGTVKVIGDHDNICPGVAPASTESDAITFETYSVDRPVSGDLTGDGRVDIVDLAFVAARFGTADSTADVTGDGTVDIFDLTAIAQQFGP